MEFVTLENRNGIKLKLTNYGGIVSELHVPDRSGAFADVTLGFETLEEYESQDFPYFGALVGRFANRIAGGRFALDGVVYDQLALNDGENHLHGGKRGFDRVVWDMERVSGDGYSGVVLRYLSVDGEEGYPGNLRTTVTYKLTDRDEWVIDYEASTDKPTIFNPTNHAYFNLAGHDSGSVMGHEMQIAAKGFTPTDAAGIPTGEIMALEGTGLDFRQPKPLGRDIESDDPFIDIVGGYDHNFALREAPGELALAAVVYEPESGREMKVYTTEPGMQLYTANFLQGALAGKGGYRYQRRDAFCLETQHYPDSPNHPQFPSTVLRPGHTFRSQTVYAFSAR